MEKREEGVTRLSDTRWRVVRRGVTYYVRKAESGVGEDLYWIDGPGEEGWFSVAETPWEAVGDKR